MTVQDVLIGDRKVIVETDTAQHEFEKTGAKTLKLSRDVPSEVADELRQRGFQVSEFPMTVVHAVHDDANPVDYKDIAQDLGMSEDTAIVQRVANVGAEIELKIRVDDNKTAYVTHVDGHKLETEKPI